jgi:hypothetical protein
MPAALWFWWPYAAGGVLSALEALFQASLVGDNLCF